MTRVQTVKLVYDVAIPRHRYLRHFEVPQLADYEPLRRILATPSKTRCRKSAPICILLGASKKISTAQKANISTCVRGTPARSGPGATIMHSVGGPFATCIFMCFRRTPARSDPGAAIMHSVRGPFATCIFTCFRGTPARSGPGATIMHSVWGPFATCVFAAFPGRPRQKRPWSHHSGFCVGSSGTLIFHDVCSSGHSPDGSLRGSVQVRPEPPLSVPYRAGGWGCPWVRPWGWA